MIESKRTILRRFTLEDLTNVRGLESDEEVVRFTPMRVPQSEGQTLERLKKHISLSAANHPWGIWAAELKSNRAFVGWFMLMKISSQHPELGFMLMKRYWRQGFAAEVANALCQYAFEENGAEWIDSGTDPENIASITVLQKLGFSANGTGTKYDAVLKKEVGLNLYRLNRKKWLNQVQ